MSLITASQAIYQRHAAAVYRRFTHPAGEWKMRAYDYCTAQGGEFVGYDLFGACPTDAAP